MTKSTESSTVTVHIPMKFAIRGGRKTFIFDGISAPQQQRTDNALLKAIARAYRWRKQIEMGEYSSITELAKAQKINQSYACRIFRLTLLAPEIVVRILDGRQHDGLMLETLTKPISSDWDSQLRMLAAK